MKYPVVVRHNSLDLEIFLLPEKILTLDSTGYYLNNSVTKIQIKFHL